MSISRHLIWLGKVVRNLGLLALLLGAGAYAYVHGRGNFHEVEKGVLFRSARLGADGLEKAINQHGIKSVLNLCGPQPGVDWYEGEARVAQTHGVFFRNLALSANQEWDEKQLAEVMRTLREAPKPLLIHCRAGSDRTGLTCALFVASRGGSYRDACEQLGLYYGHFPYLGSKSVAMEGTLERFFERVSGRQVAEKSSYR
jgi:protein tyrosine/serine phosphatase